MAYKVIVTEDAELDLERFIKYLIDKKKNRQAAKNLLDDYEDTVNVLRNVAESLQYCTNLR